MCYDKTGPWNLSKAGQHSPYSMVEDDFNYFHNTRGIASEKLLIGLPFYGYGFGRGVPESLAYKDICNTYPNAFDTDSITVPVGGTIYYNGRETIRKKTSFAILNKLSGVMIWQLSGDSKDSTSLLKMINSTIELSGVKK
jgi:GH18 family chitinase